MFGWLFKKREPYVYKSSVPGFMEQKEEIEHLLNKADKVSDLELVLANIGLLINMAKYKGDGDIIDVLHSKYKIKMIELKRSNETAS